MTATAQPAHVILNVNVLDVGIAPGAWTLGDVPAGAFVDAGHFVQAARTAERGTLDALFLADGPALREDPRHKPGRALEPGVILSAVAAETEHLGLIGTLSTTFNDPVDLAERLLSLDHASGGRLGWNVVTTYSPAAAGNFGLSEMPDRDARYRRAGEFVELVRELWDSALDGGIVHHRGEYFDVEWGLRTPPSAQGYPLLVQAGGSPAGRILAGRSAHAVFSAELTASAAIRHYRHVKAVAREAGRDPAEVKILPGLTTVIGSTEAEALQRFQTLFRSVDEGPERVRLEATLGVPLDSLDFDRPLPEAVLAGPPDPSTFTASLGFRESIVELARERDLTLRQLIRELRGGAGHRAVIGTPVDVADTIEDWFRRGAADGFNLMPDAFPSGLTTIVDEVVPILRRRGLFRHEYAESTLRERFGSPVPAPAVVRV